MFSFDEVIDRKGSNSYKWDETKKIFGYEDVLPMWVADMDFKPPQEVIDALQERVAHGVYGYSSIASSVTDSVVQWQKQRHNWEIKPDWVLYSHGVVPSISTIIQGFTEVGDEIIIQTPVYAPFYEMVKINNRKLVHNPLKLHNGHYDLQIEQLDDLVTEKTKLMILCSPHNPVGRVWTYDQLKAIGEWCVKHNVLLLSDEIHQDLIVKKDVKHIPTASISDEIANNTITCVSPSKTFNLAGLQSAAVIISNPELKQQYSDAQRSQGFHTLSPFATAGMETAYRNGEPWLNDLLVYLEENIDFTIQFLQENLPELKMWKPEGTYLLWIDCSATGMTDDELKIALLEKGQLAVEPGVKFGPGGEGHIRLNVACPRSLVEEGLKRLKKALR